MFVVTTPFQMCENVLVLSLHRCIDPQLLSRTSGWTYFCPTSFQFFFLDISEDPTLFFGLSFYFCSHFSGRWAAQQLFVTHRLRRSPPARLKWLLQWVFPHVRTNFPPLDSALIPHLDQESGLGPFPCFSAAGKSTFFHTHILPQGYQHVSRVSNWMSSFAVGEATCFLTTLPCM